MRRQAQHQKGYSRQLQGFKSSFVRYKHHNRTITTHKAKVFMEARSVSKSKLESCMPFSARERLSKWFDNREVVRWFDSWGMARWLGHWVIRWSDHRGVVRWDLPSNGVDSSRASGIGAVTMILSTVIVGPGTCLGEEPAYLGCPMA